MGGTMNALYVDIKQFMEGPAPWERVARFICPCME